MDDKTLLELAAKAAGIEGIFYETPDKSECGIGVHHGFRWWNPRDNDGDCARMEAVLDITPGWVVRPGVVVSCRLGMPQIRHVESEQKIADHGGDKQAARRMASTMVAAEIGWLL